MGEPELVLRHEDLPVAGSIFADDDESEPAFDDDEADDLPLDDDEEERED
jgi:hypothetical protein